MAAVGFKTTIFSAYIVADWIFVFFSNRLFVYKKNHIIKARSTVALDVDKKKGGFCTYCFCETVRTNPTRQS